MPSSRYRRTPTMTAKGRHANVTVNGTSVAGRKIVAARTATTQTSHSSCWRSGLRARATRTSVPTTTTPTAGPSGRALVPAVAQTPHGGVSQGRRVPATDSFVTLFTVADATMSNPVPTRQTRTYHAQKGDGARPVG